MALRKSFFNKEEEKEKTDRTIQKVGGLRKPFFAETSDNTKEVETTTKEKSTIQNINPLVSAKKEPTDYLFKNLGETKQEIPTIKSANVSSDTYEGPSFKTAPEKTTTTDSSWKTIAKAVLPRNLEVYFGLTEPNAKERILQHEDTVQSYLREKRKEENVSEVTKTKEDYTPAEGFGEKVEETVSNVGYAGYVIDAFFKPAIGTLAEQFGLQNNLPQIREWGESFADKTIAEAKLTKAGQSIANVPGIFEGALLDPRFYASTVSQAVGFMGAILGTSILTTAVTRNPAAGFATGWAVGATLEDANAYQDMIDKGVSPDDANTAAQIYGALASLIENATGLRPAGGIKAFTEDFAKEAAKSSGVKKFFKTWAEEGILEEGSQQFIQNLVTMTVDKNQSLFEGVLESIIGGMIGAFPLVGATHLYNKMGAGNTKKDTVVKQTEGTTPPPDGGTPPTPPDGGTPPTPPDGETTPVEPKFTPQEVVRARDILTNSKPNVDFDPKTAATLQKTIDTYQKDIETPVLEIINEENTSLANIKVIEYPDGRWGFSYEISTDSNGILSDYLSNKLSNTKEGAIQSAKDSILEYAKTEIDNVEAEAKSEFSEIIKQLEKVNVKIEEQEVETKREEPLVQEARKYKSAEERSFALLDGDFEGAGFVNRGGLWIDERLPAKVGSQIDDKLAAELRANGVEIIEVVPKTATGIEYGQKVIGGRKVGTIKIGENAKLDNTVISSVLRHEAGHGVYFKLTPDEQAFFRANYTPSGSELAHKAGGTGGQLAKEGESFADFVRYALEGTPEKIPPKVRPLVEKYASQTKSQLTDIWNKAQEKPTAEETEHKQLFHSEIKNLSKEELLKIAQYNGIYTRSSMSKRDILLQIALSPKDVLSPTPTPITRKEKPVETQKEKVAEAIKESPKTIKEISEETNILEPNVRRILGVGAKEGTFERVEKGVYVLSKDGQDIAWVETGNSVYSLPKLASEGFKADMVFLDIPYDTPAVKGGNRGVKYNLLSLEDFSKVLDAIVKIAKTKNTPVIHMYSQAESGLRAMAKYNDLFIEKGFKPVGKGQYQKTFANGDPVTSPNGKVSRPEGILVFTQSGELNKDLKDLNFTLKRPKGYQTEKPAEMLKAMIEMTTEEGDVVLDPFAGSGVTGAEAIRAGRKAYLIETNPEVAEKITKPRVKEATEEIKELPNQRQEMLDSYREAILPEYNQNPEIVKLDAFIDKIRKLDPKNEDDAENIENGLNYEVVFSYPHSLGEMGNQTSIWSKTEPTIKEISEGIIETYQEEKMEINKPLVAGIVAKSGRDEDIEKAIDLVFENLKPEKKHVLPSTKKKAKAKTKVKASVLSTRDLAGKIIDKKTSLPILSEFKVSNGKMYTTDLEIFVEVKTDLPNGMYKIIGKDAVETDSDMSTFPGMSQSLYEEGDKIARIPAALLQEEFKKTNTIKAVKHYKEELNGVFLGIKNEKLFMWSTDSFRLYYNKDLGTGLKDTNFIIGSTDKLEKIIGSLGENIDIMESEEFVTFSGINGRAIVKKITGESPAIEQIIPSYNKRISLDRQEFISALKDMKPYTNKLLHEFSLSDFADGKVRLYAKNSENNEKEVYIKATQESVNTPANVINNGIITMPIKGDKNTKSEKETLFDLIYIQDAANVIQGDKIYLFRNEDKNRPVFFTEEKDIGNESEIETFKKKQEWEINSFINSTQILKELKDYFNDGEIKINFVKQILMKDGGEAWARHSKGIIDFVNNPLPSNTPSHEAVHAFLSLFISPEVKKQYTEEAVQRQEKIMGKEAVAKGIKKLSKQYNGKYSDKRIRQLYGEELLADNFYDHVLKRKTQSFLSKLFDEIIYFVKRLRNSRNASRLYDDILTKKRDFSYNVFTAQENYNRKEGAKSLNSQNIIGVDPIINLKRDVHITDIHGNKFVIPSEEALTPYLMNGNKTLLKDGEEYVVSKSQYQNVLSNSIKSEAKEFAPELKDTEETIKVGKNIGQRIILGEEGVYKSLPKNVRTIIEKYNYEEGDYESNNKMIAELERVGYTADYDLNGEIISLNKIEEDPTKFEQYTLPNGENYREILIKAKKDPTIRLEWTEEKNGEYNTDYRGKKLTITPEGKKFYVYEKDGQLGRTADSLEKAKQIAENYAIGKIKTGFKSAHWDEPNVLFHLRMNDRTYNGKKVSFMEEFQSDWAREARTKGSELVTKLPEGYYIETNPSQYGSPQIVKNSYGDIIGAGNSFAEARDSALDYLNKGRVPSNPLLKNWQELSIKRALVEAVNNNSDYFAWTNGEQQAARYSLSKEINSIEWSKSGETKQVNIIPKGDSVINVDVDSTGKITKTYGKAPADWTGKNLSDAIGKGISDKILSESGGSLSGEGLNIGGEWANSLYDIQAKKIVEELTGGKVEYIDMELPMGEKKHEFFVKQTWNVGETAPRTGKALTEDTLKVGKEIYQLGQGEYIITDILGDGKFKAVPKLDLEMGTKSQIASKTETFDISEKTTLQPALKITPEIKAIIKGEAPALKQPSGEEVYMPKEQSEEEFSGENAEFKSKWSVKMPLEPETKKTINKTSIITWVEKTFKIPIKGKVTHKFKASGVYYPKKWLIRLAKWGELPVMVHEVAHHIDMRVLPEGWRKNYAFRTELANLDYDQKKRRTSEGFAEYLRYKMTTDEAPKLAPVFNKFFEEFLEKNPTLKKDLGDLRSQLDTWFQQGAENRTIQHIDWEGEHTRIFGIKAKIDKAIKVIQKNYNDEFYVPQKIVTKIEEVIKRKLRPSENPAMLMEMSKGKAGAIARTFVMSSAIDEAGNPIGKSLKDILKPISRKEIRQFIAYAVSLRAINLEGRRIESGFDIDDSKFIVEKYKDRGWYEIALELTEWSNHLLDWVIHAGGLEGMAAERMRELNPIYVPFKRAFLEEVDVMRGGGGYVDTGSGIKAIKGSGRAIFNPIESMIAQSATLIAKAQKIRIATAFAELADENDLGGYITRIPAPMVGTKFDASQISDYISQITGEEVMGLEGDMLTVFTQGTRYTGKENVVTIFKDGKLKFYEIHPDLYETFKGVDPLQLSPIMKILSVFSQLLRLGATGLKLSFNFVRNPFRDSLSYSAFAKSWKANPLDPFLGNYRTIFGKKESPTGRFKSMGGALSGQIGLDRAMTRNVYDEMLLENLGKIGKTLLIIKNPLGTLQDIVSFPEMGPRSSEMERSYKKYNSKEWKEANPDWTEEDSFIQAFLDAQDVTINFTKSGKTARKINQGAAFFNVAIRGPEKLYRAFRDRPVQTIVKSILYLTTLALWSWSQNKDKEWYKNLEPAYKYNNVFFEVGDSVFRFPVPFELGTIFMALPQAALEGTSEGYGALLDILKSQIPNPMPSMIGPAVDIMSNKNYLGIPIESKSMQYQYVTERYKDYTSTLAKNLSKISDKLGMQLSPIQIDYLIDGYTGGFLRQFKVTGAELYDLPVLSDLMLRDPNYPKRQLNNYFEEYSTLGQKVNSEIATYDEENRYEDIKNFYESYKSIQLDIIDAKAKDNTEKVNKLYGEITKTLKAYGYD